MATDKVTLTLADATQQAGGVWDQPAVALVTDPKKQPKGQVSVQFYVDFQPYGTLVETTDDGRAPIVFSGLASGKHVFEAQIDGTAIKSTPVTKSIKDESAAQCSLTYRQCGTKETGYFILFVLKDKGKPAPAGKTITITDLGGKGEQKPVLTRDDGTAHWDVPDFGKTTRKRYLAISADPAAECEVLVFRKEDEVVEDA